MHQEIIHPTHVGIITRSVLIAFSFMLLGLIIM